MHLDVCLILSANSLDLVGWAWALGKSGVAERYEGGQQQDRPAPRLHRRPLPTSPPNSPTVSMSRRPATSHCTSADGVGSASPALAHRPGSSETDPMGAIGGPRSLA